VHALPCSTLSRTKYSADDCQNSCHARLNTVWIESAVAFDAMRHPISRDTPQRILHDQIENLAGKYR
jgi:hypothetical protein